MSDQVVIFGTGSLAEVVHFYLTRDRQYKVAAFTANESHIERDEYLGLPVVPFEAVEREFHPTSFRMIVAVDGWSPGANVVDHLFAVHGVQMAPMCALCEKGRAFHRAERANRRINPSRYGFKCPFK